MKFKIRPILDYLLTFIMLVVAVKILLTNIIDQSVLSDIYRQFGAARITAQESIPVNSAMVWIKNTAAGFAAIGLTIYSCKKKKALSFWIMSLSAIVIIWSLPIF